MKTPQDPEAAETVQTGGSQAVVQERLVRLLARFRGFVSARRETAEHWRNKGEPRVASSSDRAADFFERCADELERVINGETPADPGCDWPPANTLTAAANHEWAHDHFETNATGQTTADCASKNNHSACSPSSEPTCSHSSETTNQAR